MIKMVGNDITRGGDKIGWVESHRIFDEDGNKVGYWSGKEIYDRSGNRKAYVDDNRIYMDDGHELYLDDVRDKFSGSSLPSEMGYAAIRVLIGD